MQELKQETELSRKEEGREKRTIKKIVELDGLKGRSWKTGIKLIERKERSKK